MEYLAIFYSVGLGLSIAGVGVYRFRRGTVALGKEIGAREENERMWDRASTIFGKYSRRREAEGGQFDEELWKEMTDSKGWSTHPEDLL